MQFLSLLNEYQLEIFAECLEKVHCGISVPMGGGKTRLSLVLALETTPNSPILVVCSKTLIGNWISEIQKIFENTIPFVVYHSDYIKDISKFILLHTIKIVITTPEVCRDHYKKYEMEKYLINRRIEKYGNLDVETVDYNHCKEVIPNGSLIYGTHWGTFIVDEFQKYNNITTSTCRSILCVVAERKWCLSGTLFMEPKAEKILSYFIFIQDRTFPNNLPEAKTMIRNKDFKGVDAFLIKRDKTPDVIRVKSHIITVPYSEDEQKVYLTIRDIFIFIRKNVEKFKYEGNVERRKQYSGYLLAMLTYFRQCLVCPLIPISIAFLDCCNYKGRSELSIIIKNKIQELNLHRYLDDHNNILSSRLREAINVMNQHAKVIIFTNFRTIIDILLVAINFRRVFTLDGNMNAKKRESIIEECKKSDDFVLLLTFDIGSCGLNLQMSDTVILIDHPWNKSTVDQAVARVARQGQNQLVNVYYILSNTGIEDAILKKHLDKNQVISELCVGPITSNVDKIKASEVAKMLEQYVVLKKMEKLTI